MAVAIVVRRLSTRRDASVVFYGHTFNGNLKELANYIEKQGEVTCYFATLDPAYVDELAQSPQVPAAPLNLQRLRDVLKIARAGAVITDRRAHVLELLNRATRLPFIDVWHGVPFKGFTKESFAYLQHYHEVWVSSPTLKSIYVDKFGLADTPTVATGYARTDGLVNGAYDRESIMRKYGLPDTYDSVVLVAPTWQQDDKNRSIIPFGVTEHEFFAAMEEVGRRMNALFIFRAHLNVANAGAFPSLDRVVNMPYALYPDIEEFLAIADVLVTDWSSMVFDYIALARPTVFLDVPPPFDDGFTLGPEYRFGDVVSTMEEYTHALESNLSNPDQWRERHRADLEKAVETAYGSMLDGRVAQRQYARLRQLIIR